MGRSLEKRERDNAERCDKCGYSHSINKNHTLDDTRVTIHVHSNAQTQKQIKRTISFN